MVALAESISVCFRGSIESVRTVYEDEVIAIEGVRLEELNCLIRPTHSDRSFRLQPVIGGVNIAILKV